MEVNLDKVMASSGGDVQEIRMVHCRESTIASIRGQMTEGV